MPHLTPSLPAPPVSRPPKAYLAALLSLLVPGSGQFYCGYPARALMLWLALMVVSFGYVFGVLAFLPERAVFDYLAWWLTPVLHGAVAFDAFRLARAHRWSGPRPKVWMVTLFCLALLVGPGWLASLKEVQRFWPLGRIYSIPAGSMLPTLCVGDYIVAMPTLAPKRNDIVVFTPPETYGGDKKDLVKRIVGVGGDTLEVVAGKLKRNGEVVDEPYIKEPMRSDFPATKVPDGHFFMLGDHRNDSYDSRYWGPVPAQNVKYRVARILWSDGVRVGRKF